MPIPAFFRHSLLIKRENHGTRVVQRIGRALVTILCRVTPGEDTDEGVANGTVQELLEPIAVAKHRTGLCTLVGCSASDTAKGLRNSAHEFGDE